MTRAREYAVIGRGWRKFMIFNVFVVLGGSGSSELSRTRGYVLIPRAI